MYSLREDRSRMGVLLLCTLLAVVSMASLICPACDGVPVQSHGHVHFDAYGLPPVSDSCDGSCSCCGFLWLPVAQAETFRAMLISPAVAPHSEDYPSRSIAPPFLPPRS